MLLLREGGGSHGFQGEQGGGDQSSLTEYKEGDRKLTTIKEGGGS